MKRILSIFLILVMLTAGAHPVFAIHFCGGKLHSVSLMTNESVRPCCGESAAADAPHSGHTESLLTKSHASCCHIQEVQISTDDYQRQAQLNTIPVLPAFESAWIILNCISSNRIELDNSSTIRHLFPPGGLNKQNLDVLASICIYRI